MINILFYFYVVVKFDYRESRIKAVIGITLNN